MLTIHIKSNRTLRWPGHKGDYLIWLRMDEPFADRPKWHVVDLWALAEGTTITVTNRWDDLPAWFELHPTEVCNSFVYRMQARIESGNYPSEPLDGPGIWRVRAGDRMVRTGTMVEAEGAQGTPVEIVSFDDCALAFGDEGGSGPGIRFGRTDDLPRADADRINAGIAAARKQGYTDTWGPEWRLG